MTVTQKTILNAASGCHESCSKHLKEQKLVKCHVKELKDATGRLGIHPTIKVIADCCVLAYGLDLGQVDDICELSASSTKNVFLYSVHQVLGCVEPQYLCHQTKENILRIQAINNAR